MEVTGQFHDPAALDRRLGGPQSQYGHGIPKKNSLVTGIKPW